MARAFFALLRESRLPIACSPPHFSGDFYTFCWLIFLLLTVSAIPQILEEFYHFQSPVLISFYSHCLGFSCSPHFWIEFPRHQPFLTSLSKETGRTERWVAASFLC